MTQSQKARLAGFNASLSQRGVSLRTDGILPAITFRALINDLGNSPEGFELDDNTRMFVEISVLATSPGLTAIDHGTMLVDDENHVYYKVTRAFKYDIKTVFRCTKDQE